jgi:hypothetical protein
VQSRQYEVVGSKNANWVVVLMMVGSGGGTLSMCGVEQW